MDYRFIIDYTPTDPQGATSQRECRPLYGDDIAVTKNMESDEWFIRRKLDGKLTFVRGDYDWIMGRDFDGTFRMTVQSSTDGGATWHPYFTGSFSRANLEIDEDNQRAVLNGLSEGDEYNVIENARREEYDLMKVIPDSEAKEVQGEVHPALAMVDECSVYTKPSTSDIYCDSAFTAGGYNSDTEMFWASDKNMYVNPNGRLQQIVTEAKVIVRNNSFSHLGGLYTGTVSYTTLTQHGTPQAPDVDYYINSTVGELKNQGNFILKLSLYHPDPPLSREAFIAISLGGTVVAYYSIGNMGSDYPDRYWYSPMYIKVSGTQYSIFETIEIKFHYIYSSLLTQSAEGVQENILDTGDYYQGIAPFQGSGLTIMPTIRTVEQPNGHRLLPGTGEQGTTPQYYAPPTDNDGWIPLAEDNWDYASMWYKIVPSVANRLLDHDKIGSFRWTRCWTLGTCLNRLLRKITDNKVTFDESTAGSEFLYSTVNPVSGGEPFEYLFTQKSNVMRPGGGDSAQSAARCPVTLDWFLEFMRNGLNLYWWLEPRNGGTYAFRVEHVEWFRRGGSYTGHIGDDDQIFNLTKIKPRRNFLRNGDAAKRLDDQLHKYTYDMQGMTEKYTFSWQGDGGSDAFKGHPMVFRAGWIEKGSSEDHQVDNIFADLAWLMLNAGSDTASSKNYDGIFAFSGYQADVNHTENYTSSESEIVVPDNVDIWLTIPIGYELRLARQLGETLQLIASYTGTDIPQIISVPEAATRDDVFKLLFNTTITIHRIHARTGQVYNVPNVENLLGNGYLQNGPLAWPWLQNEYLHYDVPARRWGFKADSADELDIIPNGWLNNGTVKLCKKQEVPLLPLPTKNDEDNLDLGVIGGLRDSNNQLQTGIVKEAKINLASRNASLTLMYDMIS